MKSHPTFPAVAALVAFAVALGAQAESASQASPPSTASSNAFTIRVANSGAGGDPGYFYVGGPLSVTVKGHAPVSSFELCMTPRPIDRSSCRRGRVGRTIDSLAPSQSGITKLRVSFGAGKVFVRNIRIRRS